MVRRGGLYIAAMEKGLVKDCSFRTVLYIGTLAYGCITQCLVVFCTMVDDVAKLNSQGGHSKCYNVFVSSLFNTTCNFTILEECQFYLCLGIQTFLGYGLKDLWNSRQIFLMEETYCIILY